MVASVDTPTASCPESSLTRYLTPGITTLTEQMTVSEALAKVRESGSAADAGYILPVVDAGGGLTGTVDLTQLVLAAPEASVTALMGASAQRVQATEPATSAARQMAQSGLVSLPVVDEANQLVGLITHDDAYKILEAANPANPGELKQGGHKSGFSVLRMARTRGLWLVVLLAVALLLVALADDFLESLEEVATLAIFIPLLISIGGKVGTQAAAACVRALATGEVRPTDALKVAFREASTGLLLGASLGVLAFAAVLFFSTTPVALVVGLSLALICLLAAVFGGLAPLVAKRFRLDPALVGAPMGIEVVEVVGLVIYFVVASLILGL